MKSFIVLFVLFSSLFATADDKTCKAGFESEGMSYNMIRGMIPRFERSQAREWADFIHFMAFRNAGANGRTALESNASKAVSVFEACLDSTEKDFTLFGFYTAVSNLVYNLDCKTGSSICNLGTSSLVEATFFRIAHSDEKADLDLKNKIGNWASVVHSKSCPTTKKTEKLCKVLDKAISLDGAQNKETLGGNVLLSLMMGL